MAVPQWSEKIRSLYVSGANNQFILHGNVEDRLVLPAEGKKKAEIGNLIDFLLDRQLAKFDLIFTFDLGHGLRLHSRRSDAGERRYSEWPSAREPQAFPKEPADAVAYVDHFLRYCGNSAAAGREVSVAFIFRTASLALPGRTGNPAVNRAASIIRSWSMEAAFREQNFVTLLISENLNDLHSLVSGNTRVAAVEIPLPDVDTLTKALKLVGTGLGEFQGKEKVAASRLVGTTLASVEALLKLRHFEKNPLTESALADLKKELVEKDCQGLIEFVQTDRALSDVYGNEAIKEWMRQDIELWKKDDLKAMPMGYLFCGPVGTGKTFIVECLAGEAGVPVVKFKNFRDRWVGSTEGNLEKIFTFLHALGRCIVFIDEADQALGRRTGASEDSSGVSGRVYSMMAEEMSNTRNRGKILWILASSRPDLIEVDLKRPGRVDVKIPLFPSIDAKEAYALLIALCKRQGVRLPKNPAPIWANLIPSHLTPGAAEAIAVKAYRLTKTRGLKAVEALTEILTDYQSPVPEDVMDFQIGLAVRESSDMSFVPEVFRRES
ncbi:MAG: hypothetical protein ACI8UO_001205 [Verrucomicrobiales bacterium]|jgi:hypothetical protein